MKKIISLITALALFAVMLPVVASAAAGDTFTDGNFTYTVNTDTSTVTITSIAVSALSGAVTVPGTVSDGTNTYTVTALANAFKNQGSKTSGMTSLTLPDSITKFTGTATFYACKFTSIHLPANLTAGYESNQLTNTFYYCSNLTSVTLPAGITKCYGTFRNSAVRNVTITGTAAVDFYGGSGTTDARAWNDGVTGIKIYYPANGTAPKRYTGSFTATIQQLGGETPPADDTFEAGDFKYKIISGTENDSVTGFSDSSNKTGEKVLPQTVTHNNVTYTVTSVGYAAFASTSGLTGFIMPDTVTTVGTNIFFGCTNLTNVHLSEGLTNASASYQLVGTFQYCTALKTVIIPAGIKCLPKTFLYSGVENIVLKAKSTELPKGSSNEYIPVSNPDTVKIFYPADGGVVGGYKTYIQNYFVYDGSIAFKTKEDNTLEVVSVLPGYSISGDVELPASVGPLSVTGIGEEAFASTDSVTSFTVPDSVTSIGRRAFADCGDLEEVTLSKNITGTLDTTFADCVNLGSVTIPEGVNVLSGTFEGCSSLTEVKFAQSVSTLSNKAFYGCDSLTELAVPYTVSTITDGGNAEGTVFPESCLIIVLNNSAAHRYAQTYNLNYVVKPVVEYVEKNGSAELSKTYFRISGTYTVPASVNISGANYTVTSIADNAFKGQDALTVLRVPGTLSYIGTGAFSGCDNPEFALRADTGTTAYTVLKSSGLNYIADDASTGIAYKKYAAASGLEIYGSANGVALSGPLSIAAFDGSDIVSIGKYAFSGQDGITAVTMANTVTSIGKSAFAYCTELATATLSTNAAGVLDSTFEGCTKLQNVDIPAGITALTNTYNGCVSLERAVIPENVTAIYANTFGNCTGLETVMIPSTVTTFDRIIGFKDQSQAEAEYVETNKSKKWVDNPFKGATNAKLAICGYAGSAAEEFAYSSGIKFINMAKGCYDLEHSAVENGEFDVTVRDILGKGNVNVICVLYDQNGKLSDCQFLPTQFETTTDDLHFEFSDYDENKTLKVMVWNGMANMAPCRISETVKEPKPLKILVLGNSISNHGPSSSVGWFASDAQGMAATSLDKDFVHVLLAKAQAKNPNVEVNIVTAWSLEANFEQWQSLIANEYQAAVNYDADIIIAQFGENVKNNENEGSLGGNFNNDNEFNSTTFANIVKAFIRQGKDVPVIVLSSMMSNKSVVLNAKQEACALNGWDYVNLCNDPTFSESKNSAYYLTQSQVEEGIATGTFHADTEISSGVYVHPGNNGMRAMAYGLWRYVEPIIDELSYAD